MSEKQGPLWLDISDEVERTYHFPDGSTYTVNWPLKLSIKSKPEGDSHRIEADHRRGHYIRAGWIAITWLVKDGRPTVAF